MFPHVLSLRAACLVLAVLLAGTSAAADPTDQTKALKYHKVLVKRPDPGYLFDRFYNTWLDHGTVEELGQFLERQVEQSKQTADHLLLAFFYSKQGNEVRALELLSAATDADPDNALAWFLKAETEARTLAFDAAIADLGRAKKAQPDEKLATEITKLQGKLYVRNRQTAKALKVWQELLAEHADDEDLHEDIIELQISEGLYEEAAAELARLIVQTTDKYKQVLRKIRSGDVLQRAGKRSEATQIYADTLEQVGHGTWLEREILAQVEELYRREDDLSGLQAQYEKLLEQYPRRVQVLMQFAKLLVELGDNAAAKEQMARVLELTPGDRANTEAYIALLATAGNLDDAIQAMRALIDLHPEDGELQLRLATLQHNGGNKTAAAEAVKQYLAASDKSEYAFLRAARLLVQYGAPNDAESTFQQLVDNIPDSLAAKEAQAAFLYDQGRKDEALSIWQQLAEKKDRATTVHIARILASRNEHQAAYDLLHSRHQAFFDDSIYLGQLVDAAIAIEKHKEAVPWVRRRVQLARLSSDLEIAIAQAAQVMAKSGQSLDVIRELTSASKRSAQDTCLLAELLEQSGDVALAEKVLNEAARQNNAFALSQQIRMHSQRGDWRKAADATKALLAVAGERNTTHVRRLVEIYQRDDQLEEAVRWVQEWKKLSPGSVMPWIREAQLLTLQDKSANAISVLRVASQKFEGDIEVRAKLAALYEEAGQLADAERIYWRLYDDGKNLNEKIRWAQRLASVAEMDGTTQQLVERFEERHRTNRRSVEPLLALAEIHRIGYDYEQRHKALMEASRLHPDDLQLLQQIARIEESEGDFAKALDTLQRAAELDKTTRTKEQIARLHLNNGDYDRGYAVLDELANGKSADARSIEGIAKAMASVGDWERLVEFLDPQTEAYPDDYRLRYLLAVAQEEATNLTAAKQEFLRLLLPQKRIPGLPASQAPQSPWAAFLGPITSLLPADSQEIMQLGWLHELAYQHRDQSSGFYSMSSISQAGSSVAMPPDASSVRQYALAHLLSMGRELEEDALDDLSVQMQSRGVSNAKMLFEIPPSSDGIDDSIREVAANYPDSNGLLALSILSAMQEPKDIDEQVIQRAYDAFKDNRPQLAFMAAILLARMDETRTAPLEQAIANAATIKTPNVFLIVYIAFALGSDFDVADSPQVPQEYHQALTKQLLAWYPRLPNLGPQGFMVFYFVANALSASEDPTDFLAMLDDEVIRWRSTARQSSFASMSMFFGGGPDEQLIRPMTFPPSTLADFPPHVLSLLTGNDVPFDSSPLQRLGPDAISGHLNKVKDPTLRTLLAYPLHREDVVDETLDAMLATNPPSLDAFLLAAAKETEEMNYSVAAQLLDKARYLPMTRNMRQRIDGALVALATEADTSSPSKSRLASGFRKALSALAAIAGEEKATAPAVSSLADLGRAAALRLRRMPLQMEQRGELITALDELGLEKEAERLEESQASQPMASYSGARYYGSGTQTSQIVQFLGDGKTDQAIRLIAREFTTIARNANANGAFDPDEHHDLRQVVSAFGLVDRVFAEVAPGQSTNLLKLSTHGYVWETFEKTDEALAVYRKVLARQPKNNAIRNRLLILTLRKDVDAAVGLMRQSDPRAASFGIALCDEFEKLTADTARRRNIVDAACQYLNEIPPEDERDLTWLDLLADHLSDAQYFEAVALPSLYEKTTTKKEPSDEVKEADKVRREAHDRLCRAMLRHPSLATDGFSRLLAVARRFDEPLEPFVPIAIQALTTADKVGSDPTAVGAYHMQRYYRWYYTEMWDAEEFLVRQAWSEKDEDLIPKVVIPALTKAERLQRLEHITSLNRLFTCDEANYVEAAEAYIAICTPGGRAYSGPELDQPSLSMVVHVWKDRKLHVDLQPLLITTMREAIRRDPSGGLDDISYPGTYAAALVGIGQQGKVPEFLEAVAEVCLGPEDRRKALIEKYNRRGGYSSGGAAEMRILSFVTLAQSTMGHPELTFVVLDFLKDLELENAIEDFSYVLYELFEEPEGKRRTEKMITFLNSSPFLCELSDFDIVPIPDSPHASVLGQVLGSVPNHSAEDGKSLIAHLRSRKPQTFGTKLVVACLEKPGPFVHQALLDLLVEYESTIRASTDKARLLAHLARELKLKSEAFTAAPLKGDKAIKLQAWLDALLLGEDMAFVDEVLAARKLDQVLDEESANLGDLVMRILPPLISQDRAKAEQFFRKLVELLSDENSDYYYESDDLFTAAVQGDVNQETVAFLLDRYLEEESLLPLSDYETEMWTAPFVHSFEEALDQATSPAATASALEQLYGEFTQHFKDRPTTIFANSYCNLFKSMSAEDLKLALEWLEDKSKNGPHSQFALELLAAAQWTSHRNQRPVAEKKGPRPESLRDYHRHYMAVIQDEVLPSHFRMTVMEILYTREGERLPVPVVMATARVMRDALQSKTSKQQMSEWRVLFALQSLDQTPAWRAEAGSFMEAWNDRYLKGSGNMEESHPSVALKLNLMLGNEEDVQRMLRKGQYAFQDITNIAQLIRYGHHGPAAKLFRAGWVDIGNDVVESLIQFDSQLEQNLPAFLENIQPDDLALLAAVYLASLPDTENLEQLPKVEQSVRVRQLAEQLVALPNPRPVVAQSALVVLSQHEDAAGPIQPMLAELVEHIPLKGLSRMEEYELKQRLQNLLESYVRVCVASGDNQPIMDLLDRAEEIDKQEGQQNHYYYDDTRSVVCGSLEQEITQCLAKWPQDRIIRILPLLRHLSNPTDATNDDELPAASSFMEVNLVAHAMTDNMIAYNKWWQDLSDTQQGAVANRCASWSVSQAAACLGDRTAKNLDLRIRVLTAVLRTAETQGWEEATELDVFDNYEYGMPNVVFNFLYSSEDAGLLTSREMLEHGSTIAESAPSGGLAWAALAMSQAEQRQLQEALDSWQKAIDLAPKDNSYRQTGWRIEKARLFERLKRNAEALEALKSLAPNDIHAQFKTEYTTMMEMLSKS